MSGVDIEIVQLIGAIYDAVIAPDKWHEALDRVRRHFHLHNAAMELHDLRARTASVSVLVNISDEWAAAMVQPKYSAELVRLLGGRERVEGLPLEEPVNVLGTAGQEAMEANEYYIDLAQPNGIIDSVAIILTRDRFRVGNIGLGRHRDAGPITPDVLAGLRVVAPHLRRAALVGGILEEERHKRKMFEAVVDAVRTGVVLVDADANIVHANPAARDVMANGDPLAERFGRLQINGEVVHGALNTTILASAEGDIALGRRGIAIPGTRADGEPFVVHVMPLTDRSARSEVPGETVAAVFIAERGEDPHHVLDAATVLYSLTPAEARIFELILDGRDNQQISHALSISPNTLKSHTRHLLEKTGQQRRAGLVRLASTLRSAV